MTTLERAYRLDPGVWSSFEQTATHLGCDGWLCGVKPLSISTVLLICLFHVLLLWQKRVDPNGNRSWESFKKRVLPNVNELMKAGVSIRVPFEIAR